MGTRVIWATAVAVGVAGCQSARMVPDWCASESSAASIFVVDEGPVQALRLVERWRVGGVEGAEVFARPNRPSVSREGRVAIPDMMASTVVIMDPDGTWRGSIVQQGDGPGEVQWPVDVEWLAEDRLAVFDLAKGEVLRLSDLGDLIGSPWQLDRQLYARIAASGSLPGGDLMSDGSLILELPWERRETDPSRATSTVVRLHQDGLVDTLQSQPVSILNDQRFRDWPVPGAPPPVFAAGAEGPLFLAGADPHYRIRILSASGRDSILLCREVPPLGYTPAELGQNSEPVELMRLLRQAPRPAVPAAIGGIFPGERGRLWVLRDRPHPAAVYSPSEGGRYDIFDPSGSLVGSVTAPERVFLVGEGGGQVYGFERGHLADSTLVAYTLSA